MADTVSFKRLILRAVLRQVSPMVIRLISVSDQLRLPDFHDILRAIFALRELGRVEQTLFTLDWASETGTSSVCPHRIEQK